MIKQVTKEKNINGYRDLPTPELTEWAEYLYSRYDKLGKETTESIHKNGIQHDITNTQ